jgi:hypothetical protein
MKESFMQLRKFGKVSLVTTTNGKYYTRTEFHAPDHTEIKVVSATFDSPDEAIQDGIEKCKETVSLVLSLELPK